MGKRVVVIASGQTERVALPYLVANESGSTLDDVLIPPGHRSLDIAMAEKLIKAAWYSKAASPPDKFVILLDVDGKDLEDVLRPFRERLPGRLPAAITAPVLFSAAQWHLEAWYFADSEALRDYLGGSLGSTDASKPDEIQNPKLHLKHLLAANVYTSIISKEIAARIRPEIVAQRSPSFRHFVHEFCNGKNSTSDATHA